MNKMMNRIFNVIRYTESAWMKCYPDSYHEEWYYEMMPNHILSFLRNKIDFFEKSTGLDLSDWKVRVITIDDEYFTWLKNNGLNHSQKSVEDYARKMSHEKATELLKKHGLVYEDNLLFLHLLISSEHFYGRSTKYKLNNENIEKLAKYMKNIYEVQDVYVPGYLLTAEMTELCEDDLYEEAARFFAKEKNEKNKKYLKQTYDFENGNLNQLYIPYIVRVAFENAVFKVGDIIGNKYHDDYLKIWPEKIVYRDDILNLYGLYNIENINSSGFAKSMSKAFSECNLFWHEAPVLPEDVFGVEEMYIDLIEETESMFYELDDDFEDEDTGCEIIKFFNDKDNYED